MIDPIARKQEELAANERLRDQASWWGEDFEPPQGERLSDIALEMLGKECYAQELWANQINRDTEWAEAVNDGCIQLGLDYEGFAPTLTRFGNKVELRMY